MKITNKKKIKKKTIQDKINKHFSCIQYKINIGIGIQKLSDIITSNL